MLKETIADAEDRMRKTCELFRKEMAGIRAGRASPALLERVTVDYYGTQMAVNQVATVSVPESRLLVIQPWDRAIIGALEKAILKSDLGLTPRTDANVIRLTIPPLTEERRTELARGIRKKAEEERVAVRNIRREAIELLRDLEKEGEITEDELHRAQEDVQKLTDRWIKEIDAVLETKEKEIMEV
jgi:ribosome recycling factor